MWKEVSVGAGIYLSIKLVSWLIQRYIDHQSFKKHGIKGPKPSFFSGHIFEMNHNPNKMPIEVHEEWLKEYGNVFGYFVGSRRYLVINDVDTLQAIFTKNVASFRNRSDMVIDAEPMIHSVLVLKDDEWKKVRRVITPVFSNNKVNSDDVVTGIESCIDRTIEALKRNASVTESNGTFTVDVNPVMQATSLDTICRVALNMKPNVHEPGNDILNAVKEFFSGAQNKAVDVAILLPFLKPLMTFINNYLTSGKMTDLVVKHIKDQIVDQIRIETSDKKAKTVLDSLIHYFKTGQITKEQVIGNAHLVLLGGYETTATSMSFMLHLIAKHPEVQEKLRKYFNEREEEDYFEKVWLETLRILPPVPLFVVREASQDVTINEIFIQKGTVVQAPVWQLHHRPDLWTDPDKFDPDLHFSAEARKNTHPMAFIPFGAGPRLCLGMALATQEVRLLIKRILSNYRLELESPDKELKLVAVNVFINPGEPVNVKFVPLSD